MFGIEALDVVIGMIFIYLLFSLFVTIVNEIVSSFRQTKGRELKFAIEQMIGSDLQKELYDDVRVAPALKRSSSFYMVPIIWPIIKTYRKRKNPKPKKELETILDTFKGDKSLLKDNREFFKIIKNIEIQLDNPDFKKLEKKVFPSEIPPRKFAETLYSLIENKNPTQLNESVKKRLSIIGIEDNEEVNEYKTQVINQFEDWYDEVMLYLGDWYKRKLRYTLLFWGFLIAAVFNVNSISIFEALVNDPETRAAVVQQAQEYVDNHQLENGFIVPITSPDTVQKDTLKGAYALRNFLNTEEINRLNQKIPNPFPLNKDSTRYIDSLKTTIQSELSNEFPILVKLDSTYMQLDLLVKDDIAQLSATLGLGWDNIPNLSGFDRVKDWSIRIFGWLITAIALSMGAPFWFDLLKKVINLKNELKGHPNSESKKRLVG